MLGLGLRHAGLIEQGGRGGESDAVQCVGLGIIEGPHWGWTDPRVLGALILAALVWQPDSCCGHRPEAEK